MGTAVCGFGVRSTWKERVVDDVLRYGVAVSVVACRGCYVDDVCRCKEYEGHCPDSGG